MRPLNPPTPSPAFAARPAERGFTLIELLTSTAIAVFLVIIVLDVFEASSRINRVQSDLADIQQSQRIVQSEVVRLAAMAGRGGLPAGPPPNGIALAVRNNVTGSEHINPGDVTTPEIREGSDVLTIRGVFSSPIYQISYGSDGEASDFALDDANPSLATAGTVTVRATSRTSIPQDLGPLKQAINNGYHEALILTHPLNSQIYGIVELDPDSSVVNDDSVVVAFLISGGTFTDLYVPQSAGGGYPPELNNAAFLGIVEEYRYFVREQEVGGEPFPVLARARTYPWTVTPYAGLEANWGLEIADNAYDQQVSYGIDTNDDGVAADGNVNGTDTSVDEYLFNATGDDASNVAWRNGVMSYLRVTTLVRGDRADNRYEAPLLNAIEDHEYDTADPFNSAEERMFRRRIVTTTVDLRNLG